VPATIDMDTRITFGLLLFARNAAKFLAPRIAAPDVHHPI
jgi:hypothetical protein